MKSIVALILLGETHIASFTAKTLISDVGYNAKDTASSGKVMIAPSFLTTGGQIAQKFKLSSIKVTGYSEGEAYGEFALSTLTTDGRNDKEYFWFDNEDIATPGWYDAGGEVPFAADEIEFEAGQAFWTQGEGMTAQFSGEVNCQTVTFGTASSGKVAIGNPFPCGIKLSNIYVTGYSEGEAYGEFALSTLTTDGRNDDEYFWFDNEDVAKAGWYDAGGEVPFAADTIIIPAAQGFWVQGEGMTLNFDKLDL